MEIIKKYLNNEFFIGSFILLVLSNLANIFSFLFQFLMARLLSAENFGVLSFLSNLLFLFGVPALAIQMTLSKKTTELNCKKEDKKIKGLLNYSIKKIFKISIILIIFYLIISFLLRDFVKIPYEILALFSIMIPVSLIYPAIIGTMQGMKKFEYIGIIGVVNFGIKLVLGTVLVLLGFEIWGALAGITIGMYCVFIFGFYEFKDIKEEKQKVDLKITGKGFEIIGLLIITLSYSIDILIAKFIFSPEIVGNYSKISLIGKMILFAGITISIVMFPISSEKKFKGQSSKGVFKKALGLNLIIISTGILIICLFKEIFIKILFGSEYIYLAEITPPIVFGFGFITLASFFVLYRVSIDKFNRLDSILFLIAIISQIMFLGLSENIGIFINRLLYSTTILFLLSVFINIPWKKSA